MSGGPPKDSVMLVKEGRGRIVALVGMPGSGKSLVSEVVSEAGFPVLSMGDLIREEVATRGLKESPESVGSIARGMREMHGEGVWALRLLEKAKNESMHHRFILIEGMRDWGEWSVYSEAFGDDFAVLAVIADKETRWKRIEARKRGEDGDRSAFDIRDERERRWGVEGMAQKASWQISNQNNADEFRLAVRGWLDDVLE